jgi:hypothetical protein
VEALGPTEDPHIFVDVVKNKILTHDNLAKRKKIDDLTCLFCSELESASICSLNVVWLKIFGGQFLRYWVFGLV